MQKIIPVILCGGSGTRLWPLSRQKTPKQFLKLLGDETLLQRTACRTKEILQGHCDDLIIVTLAEMAVETKRQLNRVLPDLPKHILSEPEARNTAAAIAYASQYVSSVFGPDACLWILPADHYIGDNNALQQAVFMALEAAENDYLVVFGIKPTRPETGYGYIQKKDTMLNRSGVFAVKEFHEKPHRSRAALFVESRQYLWNSGMHLFKASAVQKSFLQYAPEIWSGIKKALENTYQQTKPSPLYYAQIENEPFEKAVLEHSERVAVIPCDPKWSDIGSWESLWDIHDEKDEHGNACKGTVYCEETRNSMIYAQNRLVTCIGMRDIIVIETGDSVLVASKNCSDSLKKVVSLLKEKKRQETIAHIYKEEDWDINRNTHQSASAHDKT